MDVLGDVAGRETPPLRSAEPVIVIGYSPEF
jgi:hypothetical protein